MKKIKSFEDACDKLGITTELPVCQINGEYMEAIYKLVVITEAINDGWKPDYADINQCKWYNTLYKNRAGVSCRTSGHAMSAVISSSGSRLCFETREIADYAHENFKELYEIISFR